jgi:hypothetical protein
MLLLQRSPRAAAAAGLRGSLGAACHTRLLQVVVQRLLLLLLHMAACGLLQLQERTTAAVAGGAPAAQCRS